MEENMPLENQTPEPAVLPKTPETIPATPVIEQKKKPWVKIVILLIVILLVCAGLVFAGMQIQKRQVSNKPTPTPEVIVTPTLDPTADWQTYTNSKYNFSFRYPADWKVTASPITGNEFNLVVDQKSNTSEAGLVPIQLSVNMAKDEKGNTLALPSIKEAEAYYLKSFNNSSVVRKNVTIADRSSVSIIGLVAGPGPGEGSYLHYTLVPLNNEVLVIQLGQKNYQSVFDQILSTFKFLDETEKVDISSWKTYANSDVSFKYPSDWIMSGNSTIKSADSQIKIVLFPQDSTLMNECMEEISTENKNNYTIKKFKRVTTGAMCSTSDSTSREIWIMPSSTVYSPGISYQYFSAENIKAETIFDQILSTFKFINSTR